MSETPEIGGRKPIGDRCRSRQELLVVRLRPLQVAAVLRRLAQGHGVLAARIQGRETTGEVWFCTCKRTSNAAAVRRQP